MSMACRIVPSRSAGTLLAWLALATGATASAQGVPRRNPVGDPTWPPRVASRESESERSIRIVVNALRANPGLAAYPIKIGWQARRITVSGKVGSRAAYDQTIRCLLYTSPSPRD